jgi:hypothetical protein
VDYRVPGGIAGKVLGKTIEPFVKLAVEHSTHNLTTQIAEFHTSRQSWSEPGPHLSGRPRTEDAWAHG